MGVRRSRWGCPRTTFRLTLVRFARRTLRKRCWIILGLFLLVAMPGSVFVYCTSPRLYEASATLFWHRHDLHGPVDDTVIAGNSVDAATNRSNLAFHVRLYEALQRHDSPAAGAITHEHVLEVQDRLRRLLPGDV